jgi:hypothetical protein
MAFQSQWAQGTTIYDQNGSGYMGDTNAVTNISLYFDVGNWNSNSWFRIYEEP